MFEGRRLCIASMHQKERVLAPLFEKAFKLDCFTTSDLDTDAFGTFSGDVERKQSALDTARLKCNKAIELTHCDLVLASEGSFGAHPVAGILPMDEEILVFKDLRQNIEVTAKYVSLKTNFSSCTARTYDDLSQFLEAANFPSHAIIIKSPDQKIVAKALNDRVKTIQLFNEVYLQYDSVILETDMRAILNPTRMQAIENCGKKLVATIQSTCPVCGTYGFAVANVVYGLPCENCNFPTKSVLKHIYECKHCGFVKEKNNPHGKVREDAMYCDICNP